LTKHEPNKDPRWKYEYLHGKFYGAQVKHEFFVPLNQ